MRQISLIQRAIFWASLPFVAVQAVRLRKRAPRFPAAEGERVGAVGKGKPARLLCVGDSIIDGVGARTIDRALVGGIASAWANTGRKVHYQAIEARREQLAKIRHDFNNQLTAAYHLINLNDREMAGQLLDEMKTDIAKTKEYAYCANAIANAVLTEKAAECEEHGIRLTTEIELPEEPPIQAVQLCSVFSNLFDNAIKAAKECAEGERFVSVRATHHGDYLHVKVENSAPDPKTKKESARKKYGQEDLADIASRYDGELNYSWKDGVYSAMVSLTVRVASPALHGG